MGFVFYDYFSRTVCMRSGRFSVLIGIFLEVDSTIDSLPLTFFPHFSMSVDEHYALMVNTLNYPDFLSLANDTRKYLPPV